MRHRLTDEGDLDVVYARRNLLTNLTIYSMTRMIGILDAASTTRPSARPAAA